MSTPPTVPSSAPTVAPHAALPPSGSSRPRAGHRARWLASRTRNAARHGLLIAAVGALVVIGAVLLFVLVPQQANRALATQIAALPPERDTLPLHLERLAARRDLTSIETSIAAAAIASRADVTLPRSVVATPDSGNHATVPPARDSATNDLQRQLLRIRQSPLVESYRALADTRLLRDDARVRTLIDSIEQLQSVREAYAALSGPDARYASMTASLTQLGQRLTRLAELAFDSARTNASSGAAGTMAGGVVDSASTAPLLFAPQPLADSALARSRDAAAAAVVRTARAMDEAMALNVEIRRQRDALRARMPLDIPPIAMLLSSLVLGFVVGFTVVLTRELRRPTVGDEQELEALTRTRVIVHRAAAASMRASRARRRADERMPTIIQHTDAAWRLLHLTLSSIGDVSRFVEVIADQPVLAGAVALNLSAVAAHESRATVLVDAAERSGALLSLLPVSVFTTGSSTMAATMAATASRADAGPARDVAMDDTKEPSTRSRWDAPRSLAIGRDTFIDIVLPRRVRSPHTGVHPGTTRDAPLALDDLQQLAVHHDLAVYVTGHDLDQQLPLETDVVLCVRPGVTTLAWVSQIVRQLEGRGRRVRATVLWAADLPLAG